MHIHNTVIINKRYRYLAQFT